MVHIKKSLQFEYNEISPSQYKITVTVPSEYVDAIYSQAVDSQKSSALTYGFAQGQTPAAYIEVTYRAPILDHTKSLLMAHCVEDRLLSGLFENQIGVSGDCILRRTYLQPHEDAIFEFTVSSINPVKKKNWRELFIKTPTRKNYKDLDRQVQSFIKEEMIKQALCTDNKIKIGDFVCFDLAITDSNKKNILGNYKQNLWLKIGEEEADRDLIDLFIDKTMGSSVLTQNIRLQEYISPDLDMPSTFLVTIKTVVPSAYFDFEKFKTHFEIKTNKEMEAKLIEVFSYRNNLSQRRETVEVILAALSKNFNVDIPNHLLSQHKLKLLSDIQDNPDYLVYKAQQDFEQKVAMLAKKQLKEIIIIDAISHQEKMTISHEEIINYLNLLKRPRTKDFLYFLMPSNKLNGLESPISSENIKQYCIREKTLNYVINFLTKQ